MHFAEKQSPRHAFGGLIPPSVDRFLEGLLGITLGKWISGLRVEQVGGGKPGLIKGLLRNALQIVNGLPVFNIFGILLILTSEERARYGDRIAGTRVIQVR